MSSRKYWYTIKNHLPTILAVKNVGDPIFSHQPTSEKGWEQDINVKIKVLIKFSGVYPINIMNNIHSYIYIYTYTYTHMVCMGNYLCIYIYICELPRFCRFWAIFHSNTYPLHRPFLVVAHVYTYPCLMVKNSGFIAPKQIMNPSDGQKIVTFGAA